LISNLLQVILDTTSDLNITTVIIGGFALPAYNVTRTTLDLDICVNIKSQEELDLLIKFLREQDIKTIQNPKLGQDLFTVFGRNNEAEVWLKPCDAFQWDEQMVERIQQFFEDINVLAVEDYILTKIARADRSSTDISDILQILIANKDRLNWKYLQFRLKWANIEIDFKEILKGFELDFDSHIRDVSKEILDKFND